jgi:hypothetical protein
MTAMVWLGVAFLIVLFCCPPLAAAIGLALVFYYFRLWYFLVFAFFILLCFVFPPFLPFPALMIVWWILRVGSSKGQRR